MLNRSDRIHLLRLGACAGAIALQVAACGSERDVAGSSLDAATDSHDANAADDAGAEPAREDDIRGDAAAADGSGIDADGDSGQGAALRALLAPDACLAAAVADEAPVDAQALAGIPAEVRRWAPLTALVEHAGLASGADATGQQLFERRAAAVERARGCADAACVVAELAYDAETLADLTTWLTAQRRALGSAQLALGLTVDPPLGGSDAEWAEAVAKHHAASLDAGLRVGVGGLDGSALAAALAEAPEFGLTGLDGEAALLAGALATASGNDEAIRYEPHLAGENAAAMARLATIDLDDWPYAAIVVPGQGPTDAASAISPLSIERVDLAVERLRAGLAPFVLLSGGHVHPDGTPYSEAIEMKRRLMEVHGIGQEQILVDPWARHTTTNLRNAARVLAHLGVALDRPVLVTSDPFQSVYIAVGITQRSIDELGYVPWRALIALGPNDACAVLTRTSMRVDPGDARDP